jgi:hypothetical protein
MGYIRKPVLEESRFILKVVLATLTGSLPPQQTTDSSRNPAALSAPASDSNTTELRQFSVATTGARDFLLSAQSMYCSEYGELERILRPRFMIS